MAYLICGLGQAGGKIVDEMFSNDTFRRIATPFAINSTAKDLGLLEHVPRRHWLGISQDKGLVSGEMQGFEHHVAGGFGKDPRRAHEVCRRNYASILNFFKDFAWKEAGTKAVELSAETEEWASAVASQESADTQEPGDWEEVLESIPFALIVLGLGGGTGSGIAATMAKAIRESSSVDTTIIAVGVLPATFDNLGIRTGVHRQAWNSVFALKGIEKYVDGIILVDNETLAHTGNPETYFPDFNRFIANVLVELMSVHLLEEIDPASLQGAAMPIIDIQDVKSALTLPGKKRGRPGYSSLGWAAIPTQSAPSYMVGLRRHQLDATELTSESMRKQSLAGVRPEDARKSLGLLRVPIHMVRRRKSFPRTTDIEALLAECASLNEVHFGITVTKKPLASLTTLFTFAPEDVERLKRLAELAQDYEAGEAGR